MPLLRQRVVKECLGVKGRHKEVLYMGEGVRCVCEGQGGWRRLGGTAIGSQAMFTKFWCVMQSPGDQVKWHSLRILHTSQRGFYVLGIRLELQNYIIAGIPGAPHLRNCPRGKGIILYSISLFFLKTAENPRTDGYFVATAFTKSPSLACKSSRNYLTVKALITL